MRRKAFTPSELVYIAKAIEGQERDKAKQRQSQAGKKHGRGQIASDNLSEAIEAQPPVRDVIAAKVGWSGRPLQ